MNEKFERCPFCGDFEIVLERVANPLVYWDSNMRGEYCYAVLCVNCGANVRANTPQEAIGKWNEREVT